MTAFLERIRVNTDALGHSLCLGLDPDPTKLPDHLPQSIAGVEQFCEAILEEVLPHVIAVKPNISFFEALGLEGLHLLERLMKRIPASRPVILDAKRGDIGNTSAMQAKFIFDVFGADATTVHPYMGDDSVEPFVAYQDKFVFVLGLTSNPGAQRFEQQVLQDGRPLWQHVSETTMAWGREHRNTGLVVGATQQVLPDVRRVVPDALFLVPGVGAQGATYLGVIADARNSDGLTIIPVSRALLYASQGTDFATAAAGQVQTLVQA